MNKKISTLLDTNNDYNVVPNVNKVPSPVTYSTNDAVYKLPEIPIEHQHHNPEPIFETRYESNQETINKIADALDIKFLLVCIGLLLFLLILVGFVGYWVLFKHDNYNDNSNKSNKQFLRIFLYGIGVTILLVILFLFYLITYH